MSKSASLSTQTRRLLRFKVAQVSRDMGVVRVLGKGSKERLVPMVRAAVESGLQFTAHSVGDGAVRAVIRAGAVAPGTQGPCGVARTRSVYGAGVEAVVVNLNGADSVTN